MSAIVPEQILRRVVGELCEGPYRNTPWLKDVVRCKFPECQGPLPVGTKPAEICVAWRIAERTLKFAKEDPLVNTWVGE